jgi:hypothetical protein
LVIADLAGRRKTECRSKLRTGEAGSKEHVRSEAVETSRGEKARGWRGREAVLTALEEEPEGRKLKRGSGGTWANPSRVATDLRTEKSPEGGRALLASSGNRRQGAGANDTRATAGESSCGCAAGKTPEERIPDVAVG